MLLFGDVLRGGMRSLLNDGDDGGGDDPPPPPEKKFTQDDFDREIGKRLGKLKTENANKDQQITKLNEQISKLTERLDEIEQKKGGGGSDPSKGEWEVQQRKLQVQVENLTTALENEKKLRVQAEQARVLSERDSMLRRLLRDAGAKDPEKGAFRYIIDDVTYDDDEQSWVIRMPSGNTAKITKDVLAEVLPDYMKEPATRDGGSGATSAAGKARKQKQSQLEEQRAVVAEAAKLVKAHPMNNSYLVEWERQKKKLSQLEAEFNQA